jgi:hypothetical protein
MKRGNVELYDLLLREAQAVADRQGKTLNDVVGAAVQAYVSANAPPRRLSFIGIGASSGPPITLEEQDKLLRQGLDPVEGWSPDRSDLVRSADIPAESEASN